MIEMINKGNNEETEWKKLPKNVRQIGESTGGIRIYLEDYAVTYLHQVESAVLLGKVWEQKDVKYIFIYGAIQVWDPLFGEEVWEDVFRDAKEFFEGSDILGWAQQVTEQPLLFTKEMNEIYKEHFDRENTIALLFEPTEKEDAVFIEENGNLKKAAGYYIYYDKNKAMQEYMLHCNEGKSIEKEGAVTDKAIKKFRKKSEEKKVRKKEEAKQPQMVRFLYAASAFLALTILVIGVTMMNNYDKMKSMEITLREMTKETIGDMEFQDVMAFQQEEETESGEDAWKQQLTEVIETEHEVETGNTETLQKITEMETERISYEQTEGTSEGKEAMADSVHAEQASYTVREGDTLADICRMYYGSIDRLDDICRLNGITDPNHIVLGQKIILPR